MIARNKYRQPVGLVLMPFADRIGLLLVVPQLSDKGGFLVELVQRVLPSDCPHLFLSDSQGWTSLPEYELPEVLRLSHEIDEVDRRAAQEVAALREAVEAERQRLGFLHTLLTGTGPDLAEAALRALAVVGYESVRTRTCWRAVRRLHHANPALYVSGSRLGFAASGGRGRRV